MERRDKIADIGVAAHICAAAEGGPRYDPSMTPEQRSNIDNCIWLCQTHAKLIDSDTATYTVEELRRWKEKAEQDAALALQKPDYLTGYYNNNGDSVLELASIFDALLFEGKYDVLKMHLEQYKIRLSDIYDELIGRYRVIYDVYCDRSALSADLERYVALSNHNGIDSIADTFVSFLLIEELRIIRGLIVSDSTKTMVSIALEHDLENSLIGGIDSKAEFQFPSDKSAIVDKMLVQIVQIKKLRVIKNLAGERIKLYSEGFYYKLISTLIDAINQSYENLDTACETEPFLYVEQNIETVKMLDITLQAFIWETMLGLSVFNKDKHDELYSYCPEVLKNTALVNAAHLRSCIHNKSDKDISDEVLAYCNEAGDYNLLVEYIASMNKETGAEFIKDRAFLYGKDCVFIYFAQVVLGVLSQEESMRLLERYSDIFQSDFYFHCLRVYNPVDDETKEREFCWLKDNLERASIHSISFYIDLLFRENRFSDLLQLADIELINHTRFDLASRMVFTKDPSCVEKGRTLLHEILDDGLEYDHLHYYYAIACQELNLIEEAKLHFALEFDGSKNVDALISLMGLRYNTNEIVEDSYLEACKHIANSKTQNISGAFFLKLGNTSEARKHFLRSMLIEPNKNSLSGFYHSCEKYDAPVPRSVAKNTVVSLENGPSVVRVAIHAPEILEGITPSNAADCMHYSATDVNISKLMLRNVGETVEWRGETYTVSAIESVDAVFCKAFFASLLEEPTTKQFHFSSAEQFLEDILSVLVPAADNLNQVIEEYDKMPIRLPLSGFAHMTKHGMLETQLYLLHQERIKIRNNVNHLNRVDESTCFIVSFDSIITLFELEIDSTLLEGIKTLCPVQVRQHLLSEISEEDKNWQSEKNAGKMYYDGKPRLLDYTPEIRRMNLERMNNLRAFVQAIPVATIAYDYVPKQSELRNVLSDLGSKCRMNVETGALGLQAHTAKSILVTDDEFISAIASSEGIPSIGITSFVTLLVHDANSLIDVSKKLKSLNYTNYLPFTLYRCMVLDAFSHDDPYPALEMINKWIGSADTGIMDEQHKDILLELCSNLFDLDKDLFDSNPFLIEEALRIMEERNPGIIEASNSLMKNLQATVEPAEDGLRINVSWKEPE